MNTNVVLTETHVKSFNNYYEVIPGFKFNNIATYSTYQEFRNQSTTFKLSKYFFIIRKLVSIFQETNKQLLYTNDFQVLFFSLWVKKLFKQKKVTLIYHQFELIELNNLNKLNKFFYSYVLKKANTIDLVVFPEINRLNYFMNDSTLEKEKAFILPNSCQSISIVEQEKHPTLEQFPKDVFIIAHLGNVGGNQHYYNNFIAAIEQLKEHKKIIFVFLGRKNKMIEETINTKHLPNLFFLDPVPHEELTQIYPFIDIGVILYKGTSPNYEFCAPNKLYELWSNGVPVISHQLKGLTPLFDDNKKGILTNFNDIDEITTAIIKCSEIKENKNDLIQIFKEELSIDISLKLFEKKLTTLIN